LAFFLWELAKNRNVQEKLRAEINETWERVKARDDSEFVADDFNGMPYLVTVGKVRYVLCNYPTDLAGRHAGIVEDPPASCRNPRVVWNDDPPHEAGRWCVWEGI